MIHHTITIVDREEMAECVPYRTCIQTYFFELPTRTIGSSVYIVPLRRSRGAIGH